MKSVSRPVLRKFACLLAALGSACAAQAQTKPAAAPQAAPLKAEVIHWWTSGGESAAVKALADAYSAAGGAWKDTAVALGEQARSVAINRIVGGNPPTAAQFNTSKQFLDVVDQGLLNNIDEAAAAGKWDQVLPETVLKVIKVKGHFYAAPVNIHMPAWIWTSKAAFKKAGI
ncbi:MAG: carbohydrate ABC transporter substrate-binding protein, partial [Burkholderiaceae bacterium]|nr:carbohydrate ABC transporter substrate-binding protein [Burkholderiaceae bacterium]